MGRTADLAGRTFGDLTVLSRAESRPVGNQGVTRGYWHCQCTCGRSCEVPTGNLTSGTTRSCGHLRGGHNKANLTGQRFKRLTVIRQVKIKDDVRQSAHWECLCDCGGITVVPTGNLTNDNSKSCGCLRADAAIASGKRKRIHGHNNVNSSTYRSWNAMLKRCRDDRPRYGGRGITVDPRWESSFKNFLNDMGPRPKGHTLDRINNDGPYSPENCRWAIPVVQSNNRANNTFITYQGRTQTIAQWAREVGLSRGVLGNRILMYGWSTKRALTTPVHPRRRRR